MSDALRWNLAVFSVMLVLGYFLEPALRNDMYVLAAVNGLVGSATKRPVEPGGPKGDYYDLVHARGPGAG